MSGKKKRQIEWRERHRRGVDELAVDEAILAVAQRRATALYCAALTANACRG